MFHIFTVYFDQIFPALVSISVFQKPLKIITDPKLLQ